MIRANTRTARKVTILLCIILSLCLFLSACTVKTQDSSSSGGTGKNDGGQTQTTGQSGSSTTGGSSDSDKPYVITMLAPFYRQEPPIENGNPVYEFVEKQTGVDLQITWVPNGELENKFNAMMAANNALMVMNGANVTSSFIRMCETGAIWDLTEIIKDYPYITEKLMNPTIEKSSLINGKRYIIPFNTPDARIGLVYRADWVENLGITLPEVMSVQDIYDLAKAFTENDPDRDGKNNTTGFNYVEDQDKEVVYGFDCIAVGLGAPNKWGYRDGKVVPYFDTPEYMDALKLLRDMYQKGYLIEEFATLGSGAKYNPILQERAGFMFTTATNAVYPGGKFDTLIATNPNARMDYKLLLLDPNGNKVINSNITGAPGGICLTTSKVKTEEDVRRILQFFVDAMSGECAKAIDIGIKDLHYSVGSDGKITVSDEQLQRRTNDGSSEIFASIIPRRLFADDWGQPLKPIDLINQKIAANQQYAIPDISVGLLSAESLQTQNTLAPIIYDARVKFIMGFIDEDGFKKAVQDWKDQGGQKIIDELQANYRP